MHRQRSKQPAATEIYILVLNEQTMYTNGLRRNSPRGCVAIGAVETMALQIFAVSFDDFDTCISGSHESLQHCLKKRMMYGDNCLFFVVQTMMFVCKQRLQGAYMYDL